MEVIAALHSQLSAANAELESIQQQTNQNAKDILRLESDNKTKAQRLLHVQEETVSLRAQLDEEANTIVMLERQIESALAEQDALTRVNNAMLPSVLKSLEKNREKMRRLKATINVLLGETSRSSYLEEQTKLVQLQIQQFREDCNGNNKVNNSVPVAEFDERYFMKCIEEEESKMAAAQEEIEIQEALNEELRAKLQSEAQDREMIPLRQRNYQFNEEDSFIVENDPGFQYYDDTEITDPPSHYPSQPLIVSTLTRTVQYETVGFASSPAMPTQMMRASNSPVKIPWYKRSRVRTSSEPATFQTGLQLLTAQEQRVEEL